MNCQTHNGKFQVSIKEILAEESLIPLCQTENVDEFQNQCGSSPITTLRTGSTGYKTKIKRRRVDTGIWRGRGKPTGKTNINRHNSQTHAYICHLLFLFFCKNATRTQMQMITTSQFIIDHVKLTLALICFLLQRQFIGFTSCVFILCNLS